MAEVRVERRDTGVRYKKSRSEMCESAKKRDEKD